MFLFFEKKYKMINFHNEDIEFKIKTPRELTAMINYAVKNEQTILGELNYVFCSDKYLLKVNQDYLKHDYYTDIITFDYSEGGEISGDIFISIDRVGENAKIFGVSFEDELRRVVIHGVLHIIGYKDKTEDEQKQMTEKENFYINYNTYESL